MKALDFITSNKGKLKEVQAALGPLGYDVRQMDIGYPEVQADTLEEVALFGMEQLKARVEGAFIIEDSGIFIGPLGGFPGVYSAYVMRTVGNPGILGLLGDRKDRGAVFRSCFGYYDPKKGPQVVNGECKGAISTEMRGSNGFGYDPIFIPDGEKRTFGEMSLEEKNKVSHRGRSLRALVELLKGRLSTVPLDGD
jgi:XTP/dITP diphosphohydrolase